MPHEKNVDSNIGKSSSLALKSAYDREFKLAKRINSVVYYAIIIMTILLFLGSKSVDLTSPYFTIVGAVLLSLSTAIFNTYSVARFDYFLMKKFPDNEMTRYYSKKYQYQSSKFPIALIIMYIPLMLTLIFPEQKTLFNALFFVSLLGYTFFEFKDNKRL